MNTKGRNMHKWIVAKSELQIESELSEKVWAGLPTIGRASPNCILQLFSVYNSLSAAIHLYMILAIKFAMKVVVLESSIRKTLLDTVHHQDK